MTSAFSASASALGYVYQFRYSLARALDGLRAGSYEWSIAVEAADDIEVSMPAHQELRQLKQVGRPLTNSSSDLWKTLRIWSEGVSDGTIDPTTTSLYLVTTAAVPAESVGSYLTADEQIRDEIQAEAILKGICETSTSEGNTKAYTAFLRLTSEQRTLLLKSVIVLPDSEDIVEIRESIASAIRIGSRREYIDAMIERLEGWWFGKCVACLRDPNSRITAEQLDSFLSDLRDQFNPNNLPIDADILAHPDQELRLFEDRTFVRQARLTEVNDRRVQIAVRDYLRAYAQRSRWSRLNLLQLDELENYERSLREEWEILFEQLRDNLGPGAAEEEKTRMAKKIYSWVESEVLPPIRSQCTEAFVKRGTYHILADSLHVGWHPDFVERLAQVLEPASA